MAKAKEMKLACNVIEQVEAICDKHGNKPELQARLPQAPSKCQESMNPEEPHHPKSLYCDEAYNRDNHIIRGPQEHHGRMHVQAV